MIITEEHFKHIEKRIERGYDLNTELEKEQAISDLDSLYQYAIQMKNSLSIEESEDADTIIKDYITI